jgi:hypothetical protein
MVDVFSFIEGTPAAEAAGGKRRRIRQRKSMVIPWIGDSGRSPNASLIVGRESYESKSMIDDS